MMIMIEEDKKDIVDDFIHPLNSNNIDSYK